ncbi:MAG TPA: HPr family phosphocarrier protein [Candidatus Polarisedimenticolaceae bacterium]|nr:HPr family phosphocarrier protein [Candidatus Polarisedimenticolaceae bacterium]
MREIEVRVGNRLGLHARAAARFVHVANTFHAKVTVHKGGSRVNGKSILGLLTLAAACGARLRVQAEGRDEEQAVRELAALVGERFGEED